MDGRPIAEQIDAMAIDALNEIGIEMLDDLREKIDIKSPPSSEPYMPPGRRTGNLQNSTYYSVDQASFTVKVAYNLEVAPYGQFLEEGTAKMAPRPALRRVQSEWNEERLAAAAQKAMDSYTRSQQRW